MRDRWTCACFRRRRSVALAVGTALLPLHLDAAAQQQQAEQQMVPLELMETLSVNIYGPDSERPAILVGALPATIADALTLPEAARIIGSVVHENYSMSSFAVPGEVDAVQLDLEGRLVAAGWEKVVPVEFGGFVGAAQGPAALRFCRDDTMSVSAGVTPNPRGGTYVMLMHMGRMRGSVCSMDERQMPAAWHRSMLPVLRAPPGARVVDGGSSGGGDDHWSATARLETDTAIVELADHYDAQLREQAWTPLERVAAEALTLHTYRVLDEDGREWYGVLTVAAPSADTQRIVSLDMTLLERLR